MLKQTLKNLSFEKFVSAYKSKEASVLIDARTKQEYDYGHLPGAVNVDYLSPVLADLLEKLDPSKSYFVYCRTSRRSLRICVLLRNMGFTNVFHLEEGIKDHVDLLFSTSNHPPMDKE